MRRRHPFFKSLLVILMLVILALPSTALAGNFKNSGVASITPSSSDTSQSGIAYTFKLYPATTGTAIKRFEFQTETSAEVDALPSGMSLTGSAGGSTTGLGGLTFTYDSGNSTPASGLVKYTNATGSTPTNPITIKATGWTNPSTAATYYIKISSYTATTGGSLIDQDIIPFTINNGTVQLSTGINETLTFSLSAYVVTLPPLTTTGVTGGPTTLSVATNAGNGYTVYGQGTTLTYGSFTIPFVTDGSVDGTNSATPTSEYGLSFASCTATCPSNHIGVATQTSVIERSSSTTGDSVDVSYRAAAKPTQPAGPYSSLINYVATGQF